MRPQTFTCLIPVLGFVLVTLAGCGSTPSVALPEPEVTLTNTYWRLTSVNGEVTQIPGEGSAPHLIFLDDGQVRGHTGCNVLKGAYGQLEGQVRFLAMGATRMACSDAAAEAAFVAAMRDTRAMVVQGRQLHLKGPDGRTLAVFQTIRQP